MVPGPPYIARRRHAYVFTRKTGRMPGLRGRMTGGKVLWLALALVLLAAALFKPALRQLFLIDHTDAITAAAQASGLEPFLVAAVVKVESGFNERARSSKGAREIGRAHV